MIHRTPAVVIGRRALGESDRLVSFYTREYGKLTGVAKSARRPRSRFGSALELFTLGDLVFFDTGRSELVRVDHFDIAEPYVGVREDLERLAQAAWAIECVTRLSADRDPHPALFRLLVRNLRALNASARPAWVAACFALRTVDLLGHRPRIDRCVSCGRAHPFPRAHLDVEAGGLVCDGCAVSSDAAPVSGGVVGALRRLRELAWDDALRLTLAPSLEGEVGTLTERIVAHLSGRHLRSTRFLAQLRRSLAHVAEPPAPRFR
jgi:DNA repair protein RecO (recombination protein O)